MSVAFKNVIGARRASWRIISSIEQKEESKDNAEHVKLIKEYRAKIEKELDETCADILAVLDKALLPSAESGESKVFYNKMKGDYHRYLAEFQFRFNRRFDMKTILQTLLASLLAAPPSPEFWLRAAEVAR